ncbi:group I intron-associated PD-(D/E)XK endonuclease [Neobacillus mesonae]|nr:group I intron-associated PD-(D/E)XK endonuclease [Neobacillus mesonae]
MNNRALKGTGAEHLVIFDMLQQGYDVDVPVLSGTTRDLSAHGKRIQVKCGVSDGVKVSVDIRRPSAKDRKYSPKDIDIFAVVEPVSRRVAYLHIGELHHSRKLTLYLTREHSRSGMRPNYIPLYFDDYADLTRVLLKEDAA